jgi:hypothetical protein
VLLPEGADAAALGMSAALWNVAEGAERRRDAQVAREIVLALPANAEPSHDDRVELARSFAQEHFVAHGLAVQLDVPAPRQGLSARGQEGARSRSRGSVDGRPRRGNRRRALWAAHQDTYFAEHGLALRVDATNAVPGQHIGPIRMRAEGSPAVARAQEIARENTAAARDPETVLRVLTRGNATLHGACIGPASGEAHP